MSYGWSLVPDSDGVTIEDLLVESLPRRRSLRREGEANERKLVRPWLGGDAIDPEVDASRDGWAGTAEGLGEANTATRKLKVSGGDVEKGSPQHIRELRYSCSRRRNVTAQTRSALFSSLRALSACASVSTLSSVFRPPGHALHPLFNRRRNAAGARGVRAARAGARGAVRGAACSAARAAKQARAARQEEGRGPAE